jgi:hypothetical protein
MQEVLLLTVRSALATTFTNINRWRFRIASLSGYNLHLFLHFTIANHQHANGLYLVLGTGAELHSECQQSILGWFGAAFAFRHLSIARTGLTNFI